jgi:hypothetical protein
LFTVTVTSFLSLPVTTIVFLSPSTFLMVPSKVAAKTTPVTSTKTTRLPTDLRSMAVAPFTAKPQNLPPNEPPEDTSEQAASAVAWAARPGWRMFPMDYEEYGEAIVVPKTTRAKDDCRYRSCDHDLQNCQARWPTGGGLSADQALQNLADPETVDCSRQAVGMPQAKWPG